MADATGVRERLRFFLSRFPARAGDRALQETRQMTFLAKTKQRGQNETNSQIQTNARASPDAAWILRSDARAR